MENNNQGSDRIRKSIQEEKEAARRLFNSEHFRLKLESRLEAESKGRPQKSKSMSAPAFLSRRPLAAAALGAGLLSLGTALWFLVLSPSMRHPGPTLEENIFQALLESSSEPFPPPSFEDFPAPERIPDHEIPLILYEVLRTLRPESGVPDESKEGGTPADGRPKKDSKMENRFFIETLKRIMEV